MIGSKNINTGTPITAMRSEACCCWAIARPASVKPRNMLPLSPIKMPAGGKLKTRKPAKAPASARLTHSRAIFPASQKKYPKTRAAISAIPPASPSILSSRLSAFVIPTSQKYVKRIFGSWANAGLAMRGVKKVLVYPNAITRRGSQDLGNQLGNWRERMELIP